MRPSCIDLDHVSVQYRHTDATAIDDLSLSVPQGEFLLLLGPSGSGKTTLLLLMAGLLRPSRGMVHLFGAPVDQWSDWQLQEMRARRMGFVFQNYRLIEALTAVENVALAATFAGERRTIALQKASAALDAVGILTLARRRPAELSQGEQQRVAIARAIVNDATLILADEPTASLDTSRGLEISGMLHKLSRERYMTVVVATHDTRLIGFADRILQLRDGLLISRAHRA